MVSVQPGADVAGLAGKLRGAGAEVQATLEAIGVINVWADEAAVNALRGVPGVAAVEEEGTVQLPPPDSEVQ
jgi:hypothetical protein